MCQEGPVVPNLRYGTTGSLVTYIRVLKCPINEVHTHHGDVERTPPVWHSEGAKPSTSMIHGSVLTISHMEFVGKIHFTHETWVFVSPVHSE